MPNSRRPSPVPVLVPLWMRILILFVGLGIIVFVTIENTRRGRDVGPIASILGIALVAIGVGGSVEWVVRRLTK